MNAEALTPILNVSDLQQSIAWFEKLGWSQGWAWGEPPTFGCVRAGDCEIFLCLNGQGGRGRGAGKMTFGPNGDETGDRGVWLSIWVGQGELDSIARRCAETGIEVTWPPTDMPWCVREMHVRHPDGHVFRIGHAI